MTTYMLHLNSSLAPDYPFWNIGGALAKCHFDREVFAQQIGIHLLQAFMYQWQDEPASSLRPRMDGIFGGLKQNDIVVVQWPLVQSDVWVQAMIDTVHHFGAKVIFLIDDMTSWRSLAMLPAQMTPAESAHYKTTYPYTEEIHFLKQADGLIVHSKAMEARLRAQAALSGDKLCTSVTSYGPSGYVCNYFQAARQPDQGIDYAGTLTKARFLLSLPKTIKIRAFGTLPEDMAKQSKKVANVTFKGTVDPEAIVQMLSGSYGLVWDSDTYPQVAGLFGEYERYNTPAKFPMYLAANEPVIVWSGSALANFVTDNHIGLVLDDLAQLPGKISQIEAEDYKRIVANAEKIGGLIRSGYYLKKALLDIQAQVLGIVSPG